MSAHGSFESLDAGSSKTDYEYISTGSDHLTCDNHAGKEVYKQAWDIPDKFKTDKGAPNGETRAAPQEVATQNNLTNTPKLESPREGLDAQSKNVWTPKLELHDPQKIASAPRDMASTEHPTQRQPVPELIAHSDGARIADNVATPRPDQQHSEKTGNVQEKPIVTSEQRSTEIAPPGSAKCVPSEFPGQSALNQTELLRDRASTLTAHDDALPMRSMGGQIQAPDSTRAIAAENSSQPDHFAPSSTHGEPQTRERGTSVRVSASSELTSLPCADDSNYGHRITICSQQNAPTLWPTTSREDIATSSQHDAATSPPKLAFAVGGDGVRLTGNATIESNMACPISHLVHQDSSRVPVMLPVENATISQPLKFNEQADHTAEHKTAQQPGSFRQAEQFLSDPKPAQSHRGSTEESVALGGKQTSGPAHTNGDKTPDTATILEDARRGSRAPLDGQVREPINQTGRPIARAPQAGGGSSEATTSTTGPSPKGPPSDAWINSGNDKSGRVPGQAGSPSDQSAKAQPSKSGSAIRETQQEIASGKQNSNTRSPSIEEQVANASGKVRINGASTASNVHDTTTVVKSIHGVTVPTVPIEVSCTTSAHSTSQRGHNGDGITVSNATSSPRIPDRGNTAGGSQNSDEKNEPASSAGWAQDKGFQGFIGVTGSRQVGSDCKATAEELNGAIEKLINGSQSVKGRFPLPGERFVGPGLKAAGEIVKVELQSEKSDRAETRPARMLVLTPNETPARLTLVNKRAESERPGEQNGSLILDAEFSDEITQILDGCCIVEEPECETEPSSVAVATNAPASQPAVSTYLTKDGDTLDSIAMIAYGKPLQQLNRLQQHELRSKVPLVTLQEQTSDPSLLKVLPSQRISLNAA